MREDADGFDISEISRNLIALTAVFKLRSNAEPRKF